jgi:hypothetical protein
MINEEENAVLLMAGFTQREINTQKRKFYNLFRVEPWLVPMGRKPLTDDEIDGLMADTWGSASIAPQSAPAFARAIERAHGIGGEE